MMTMDVAIKGPEDRLWMNGIRVRGRVTGHDSSWLHILRGNRQHPEPFGRQLFVLSLELVDMCVVHRHHEARPSIAGGERDARQSGQHKYQWIEDRVRQQPQATRVVLPGQNVRSMLLVPRERVIAAEACTPRG
jgi:hypothetical protein